ncbi:D-2-hydroxyacid dehydrogenase family protein [Lichenibacterium dinghuense]|uniref:D-2-hydroxyacid dehydrogenase family protein n=1 Tax=Lichenibacterium dinghuense TaxID=2895977 RepID=UPI001F17B2BC|nr:D-2-hydroxyacid dehydrogenase family protein [Lichenibacterium sp. 6Y81]
MTDGSAPLRIAVLDDYQGVARGFADWDSLAGTETTFFHDHESDPAGLAARLAPFDILVLTRERTPLGAELLAALPRLKLVVTMGLWNAAIDVAACAARGVPVCGTAGGEPDATPALAWGLVLGVTRGIARQAASVAAGGWQVGLGTDVKGRTLGILGLGKIGRRVAEFGRVFGMRCVAWSQNLRAEDAAAVGVERVEKDALFREADVLTVHLKLGERTRGLVGARELGLMKPTAYLVNTSRGPIVDEAALVEALRAGRLAGAGLDVFDTEPLPEHHPLRTMPTVLATPHIGYVSRATYEAAFPQMVECIAAWRRGAPVRVLEG